MCRPATAAVAVPLQIAHIANRCLVEHAPSPQTCAVLGGVWDDTAAASDEGAGGNCLAAGRAAKQMEQLGGAAEILEIEVSHDTEGRCSGFVASFVLLCCVLLCFVLFCFCFVLFLLSRHALGWYFVILVAAMDSICKQPEQQKPAGIGPHADQLLSV